MGDKKENDDLTLSDEDMAKYLNGLRFAVLSKLNDIGNKCIEHAENINQMIAVEEPEQVRSVYYELAIRSFATVLQATESQG